MTSMTPAIQRIIAALRRFPALSRREIAAHAFVANTTLSGGGYLKAMKADGLIHISAWRRNGLGVFSIPLFSLGNEEDCPRPRLTADNRVAPTMIRLLDAIKMYGPIDYRQAAKIARVSPNTVKNSGYLNALVSQEKIHICSWRRGRCGPMRAIYAFGHGREAPRLPMYSRAEKAVLARQRRKTTANASGFVAQLRAAAGMAPRADGDAGAYRILNT